MNIIKNRNQKIDYSEDDDKRRQVYQPYEFNDLALGILGGLVTVTLNRPEALNALSN